MLFRSTAPIPARTAAAIIHAVHAIDALALVDIDARAQLIRIEGQLAPEQYVHIIDCAGCDVQVDDLGGVAGHVRGGSTCCGGCI